VASELILEAVQRTREADRERIFLVGPPGTGKTAVLLNLLVRSKPLGLEAKIALSKTVARYTELCGVGPEGRL